MNMQFKLWAHLEFTDTTNFSAVFLLALNLGPRMDLVSL